MWSPNRKEWSPEIKKKLESKMVQNRSVMTPIGAFNYSVLSKWFRIAIDHLSRSHFTSPN